MLKIVPHIMVNRPLEHLVPKLERVQWYAFHEDDFIRIVGEVVEVSIKWGLPFFDDYRSAEDVIVGFEAGDERPRLQENWAIFIVAAYLSLGRRRQAEEVLESTFVTSGSRNKYAVVFENIKSIR